VDFNNTNRINIDNFIQVMSDCDFQLKMPEIQQIFDLYDLYNNGECIYPQLINDLKVK